MTRGFAWLGVVVVLAGGCSVRTQTTTSGDSTEVSLRFQREREVADRLESTRVRLDSLKSEAAALGDKAGDAMNEKIAQLAVEKDSAQVRFERLQQVGEDKWEDVRAGFAVMLDSLDVKIDRARQDLHRHG